MVAVSEAEIAHAVQLLLEIEKTLVEGAGAVGLAALLHRAEQVPGSRSVILLSGGNMDITMLAKIIDRGLIADGRLAGLTVRVPDVPGGLAAVTECISKEHGGCPRRRPSKGLQQLGARGGPCGVYSRDPLPRARRADRGGPQTARV